MKSESLHNSITNMETACRKAKRSDRKAISEAITLLSNPDIYMDSSKDSIAIVEKGKRIVERINATIV